MLLWGRVLCSPADLHLQGLAGSPHALWLWAGQHHGVDGASQRGSQPQSTRGDLAHLLPQSSGLRGAGKQRPQSATWSAWQMHAHSGNGCSGRALEQHLPQSSSLQSAAMQTSEGHSQSGSRSTCTTRAIWVECSSQQVLQPLLSASSGLQGKVNPGLSGVPLAWQEQVTANVISRPLPPNLSGRRAQQAAAPPVGSMWALHLLPPAAPTQQCAAASKVDGMHARVTLGSAAAARLSLPQRTP